uniref:U6 snRNA-associated Sm-like protein LSm4 n=1 Tax=Timema monikensis TaxID=170555 RepID=A0A7R9HRA3_9NEOP|nr:unnamed protein product [Timema monikensis]
MPHPKCLSRRLSIVFPTKPLIQAVTLIQLVELKNGETYNGHLVSCDNWMNINLREVICTSRDGDKFWRMPECYIRGSTIKYLRIPDEVIDMVKEETIVKSRGRGEMKGRGGGQARGRGVGRGMYLRIEISIKHILLASPPRRLPVEEHPPDRGEKGKASCPI